MEVLYSSSSSEVFMVKIQTLIEQLRSSIPMDTLILSCSTCSSNFPLYYNGILRLETKLKKNLCTHVEERIQILKENHETKKCPTSSTSFHRDIGIPDSICIWHTPRLGTHLSVKILIFGFHGILFLHMADYKLG